VSGGWVPLILAVLVTMAAALLATEARTPRVWARATAGPRRSGIAAGAGDDGGRRGGGGPDVVGVSRVVRAVRRRPGVRGGESEKDTETLLAFLDVLAPSLRAGRGPEEAARLACRVVSGGALIDDIRAALDHGRSVETVLVRHARTHADVRLFARAWELSALTGCPLADTVSCVSRLVRAKLAHRRRVEAASTGARASIRILTLLPLGGPLLAMAVGVDPVEAYVTSPTAWACLAAGLGLVAVGRWWVERLVAQVARGPVLAGPS